MWIVVLCFVFLECAFIIGLFLPGDSLLLRGGRRARAAEHELSAWRSAGAATVVAVVGNLVGYCIGRYAGTRLLARRSGTDPQPREPRPGRGVPRPTGVLGDRGGPVDPVGPHARADDRRCRPDGQPRASSLANVARGAGLGADAGACSVLRRPGLLDGLPWLKTRRRGRSIAFFVVGTGYGLCRYRQEMRTPGRRGAPTPPAEPRPRRPTEPSDPRDPTALPGPLHPGGRLHHHPRRPAAPTGPPPAPRPAAAARAGASRRRTPGHRRSRPRPSHAAAAQASTSRDGGIGQLGAAQGGVGEVAGGDAGEQAAVAATRPGQHAVRLGQPVASSRRRSRRRGRPTAGDRRAAASSTQAPR